MYCDCPYAESGNHCKHMAAVLYLLENKEQEPFETESDANKGQMLDCLLNEISEAEAKKFLLVLANEDSSIKNRMIAIFSKFIGKSEVDAIVYGYAGREGFIYYRDAVDL